MSSRRDRALALLSEMTAAENARDVEGFLRPLAPSHRAYVNGQLFLSSAADEGPAMVVFAAALPDYRREIQWADATDNRLICQYRLTGTHRGELAGFAPTGNRLEVQGAIVWEHDGEHLGNSHLFADIGEFNRQLGGKLRAPATATAASSGPPVVERDRARFEAAGERLGRALYPAEAKRDLEALLTCFADPFVDHAYGQAVVAPMDLMRSATQAFWDANPTLSRTVEEVISTGDRVTVCWHLTATAADGQKVSQHGCAVGEHDGQRFTRTWAYYPDLVALFPAIEGMLPG